MQRRRTGMRVLPLLALLVASCSGGSADDVVASVPPQVPTTVDAPFSSVGANSVEIPTTTLPAFGDGPLAEVCSDRIVVQASNFPDVGSGPLYALLGAAPTVDSERQSVSAPLTRGDGTVEGVTLEIRSGGPAVGFRSPIAVMAEDASVDLVLASTALAIRDRSTLATHAIVTLTDRSRDAVIIDPATYPDVTDLSALGSQGIETRHITDAPVIRFLVATGVLSPGQLVDGSDGLPASFVEAEGAVAQQGDLTIEPVLLPSLEQWGRPVTALPASDAGWFSLDDLLLTDAATERESDECLGRLVRLIQQSIVVYTADPAATNLIMSDVRAQFNPLARLTPSLLDAGAQLAIESGVFDTASDLAPGTIVTDGLDAFLADLAVALDVDPVTVDDVIDPRFVDRTLSR